MQVFITRDYLAISMQFCNGGDLYSYLDMRKTLLPENMARWFFQQLIVAVDYCHTWLNVSNRDLKLENLLLDFEDLSVKGEELPDVSKWPIIKICDFG
jgi:serine/threonine-protein kinase SRK2